MFNRLALGVLLALGTSSIADASLSQAPFRLTVSPSPLEQGKAAALRLEPTGPNMGAGEGERVDIYVIRMAVSSDRAQYLAPAGVWSAVPTAHQKGITLSSFALAAGKWQEAENVHPGWIFMIVLFVKSGGHPHEIFHRSSWVLQPIFEKVRVRSVPTGTWLLAVWALGPLGSLTLLACVYVLRYGVRGAARAASQVSARAEPHRTS